MITVFGKSTSWVVHCYWNEIKRYLMSDFPFFSNADDDVWFLHYQLLMELPLTLISTGVYWLHCFLWKNKLVIFKFHLIFLSAFVNNSSKENFASSVIWLSYCYWVSVTSPWRSVFEWEFLGSVSGELV